MLCGRQVVISLDYEIKIPEDDPVVLLCEEMERLDYTQLYEAYSRDGRSPAVSPKVMFMLKMSMLKLLLNLSL